MNLRFIIEIISKISEELQRPSLLRHFKSVYLGILLLLLSVVDLSTACHSSLFELTVISLDKYSSLHYEIQRLMVATVSTLADFAKLHVRPKDGCLSSQ
jgi:hypothetical protein